MLCTRFVAVCLTAILPAGMAAQKPGPSSRPTLVVFITVDQLRADYLLRFKPQLAGGLRLLVDAGAVFRNGFQDHAITETAPGHATTLSGRFPVHTGITANAQGVSSSAASLLGGATEAGASPFRFRGTTLVDWMLASNPATRFVSVSRKDRGAILPIGRTKGDVYWWSGSAGIFTTSSYYADSLPPWVQRFNAKRAWARYAGRFWSLLLPASRYSEQDTVWEESDGTDFLFPHTFPADTASVARALGNYPVMDSLTLAFALAGLKERQLGAVAGRTDLLAVSLSTTDAVGHKYGPDSREMHDQILWLDRYLGSFFDSLFSMRDRRKIIIALTSDHGVAPFPEVHSGRYANKRAGRVDVDKPILALSALLTAAGVPDQAWSWNDGLFSVHDASAFNAAKVNPDSVAQALAKTLRAIPGVLRADLFTDLARANLAKDRIARRWLNMFNAGGEAKLAVTLTPYSYWASVEYATHGSPHDSDANVPMLFWGAGVRKGAYPDEVRTVDIAPTLAALLGVKPTERLDGVVLKKILRDTR